MASSDLPFAATVALDHISVGSNRVVGCLDWGDGGLIAYGGHHAVAIYDPEVSTPCAWMHTPAAAHIFR